MDLEDANPVRYYRLGKDNWKMVIPQIYRHLTHKEFYWCLSAIECRSQLANSAAHRVMANT